MKKMKKGITVLAAVLSITMISCNKDKNESNLESEIANETQTIRLAESGFQMSETTPLSNEVGGIYTDGVIEYKKDGELLAKFDYSKFDAEKGEWEKEDGSKEECKLKKEGKDYKFKKVIVKPLVKTDDCEFIVAGIIKYFDKKSGKWLATVDYGDGTCDDLATKIDSEGNETTFTIK